MTYLVISQSTKEQEQKVLNMISDFFDKKISKTEDLISFPDIHILDGRDQNSIGIEEVKNFQNEMIFKPFEQKVQIGIIWESEKLTHQAQNSFLKTLEESDDHTIFLLCVNNEKNLLQTIISRSKPIYISSIKESKNEIDKPKILDMDLVDQFKEIENISKDKNNTLELINNIEQYYKILLNNSIKENDIDKSKNFKNILKEIDSCRAKINANCNKRMVLESLVIHLV